jgi:hypothetical protein
VSTVFSNVGGFFSDYFLGTLLERQLKGKLGESTLRNGERRCRALWNRTGRIGPGASAGQTRQHWLRPLFEILGYDLSTAPEIEAGRQTLRADFAYAVDGKPVALVYLLGWDDDPDRSRGRRRIDSPHQQMEEMLASSEAKWGLIATGERLRLLRRAVSAGGISYFEVDFESLFDSPDPHHFATFWALFRAEALAPDPENQDRSLLDLVEEGSRQYAMGVGEDLKEAVFEAVRVAAQGFVAESSNPAAELERIFHDTLVLMYRLLFVLYAESRGLLPLEHPVYRDSYSLEMLRTLVAEPEVQFSLGDHRLWKQLKALFTMIQRGCRAGDFVVPAFYGALFDDDGAPTLRDHELSDETVARVIDLLSMTRGRKGVGRQRVSYRELGVEQLGSVYEGLLEYEPRLAAETMLQIKYKGDTYVIPRREARDEYQVLAEIPKGSFYLAPGAGRKTTGSYYTQETLVNFLVERTLEPLVRDKTPEEILQIKVLDPAMGSGHFLVGACRYLATAYAQAKARQQASLVTAMEQRVAGDRPGMPPELARNVAEALVGTGVPLAPDIAASAEDSFQPRDDAIGDESLDDQTSEDQMPDGRGEITATSEDTRLVAERCLYGVDLNPMAVELAKVSLWLATMAGDKPLTFLDHHLKCGNSLIGARLEDIERLPIGKGKGKQHVEDGQGRLFTEGDLRASFHQLVDLRRMLDPWRTETVDDAVNKANLLANLGSAVPGWNELREVCDLWCAAWFWPDDEKARARIPMDATIYRSVANAFRQPGYFLAPANVPEYRDTAERIASRQRFFHWELEFPEVFFDEHGRHLDCQGFDAVLGNPPWDRVQPNSQEFFAAYDPRFRELGKQVAMKRQKDLRGSPEIEDRWRSYEFSLEHQKTYFRLSGHYPRQVAEVGGKRTGGDLNTYQLFLERFYQVSVAYGHSGIIVPSGLYTDEGCTGLRQLFFEHSRVDYLFGFENRNKIFPIHAMFKFILFGFSPGGHAESFPAAFMLHDPERLAMIEQHSLHLPLTLIRRFSPSTLSLLEFRSQDDIEIVSQIFDDHPLLGECVHGAWNIHFAREFHMTDDSHLFNEHVEGLRLYEGKMIHQYDAYWEQPHLWVKEGPAREELIRKEIGRMKKALAEYEETHGGTQVPAGERLDSWLRKHVRLAYEEYRLGYRTIASNTNERTLISAVLPRRVFAGNSVAYVPPLRFSPGSELEASVGRAGRYIPMLASAEMLFVCACFDSFVVDFILRFKVSANVNAFYVYGLPVPRLGEGNAYFDAIVPRVARLICTTSEFDGLARQVGMEPGNGATGPAQRQRLKNEIDALVAGMYGLAAADLAHILYAPYTFPLVDKSIKDGVMTEFRRLQAIGLEAYATTGDAEHSRPA